MAPALIPKIIKRQATKVANYVRARVGYEYDEATLKCQTFVRLAKEFMHDSPPHKVYTGAGRVSPSFKKSFAKELKYLRRPKWIKSGSKSSNRGRIEKAQSLQQKGPTISISNEAFGRKPLLHESEHKVIMWPEAAPARAVPRAVPSCSTNLCEVKVTKHVAPTYQDHEPKMEYMDEVRSVYPASEDHVERSMRIQAGLASILGPARTGLGVGLPSGHSGIDEDPILAKYNNDNRIQHTKEVFEQYQIILRQHHEQQQREEAERAAARQQKEIELNAYFLIYKQRVTLLAALGPALYEYATKLGQAYEQYDFEGVQVALSDLINHVLEEACRIFKEMEEQIALELEGANIIKNAWPLETIEALFGVFDEQAVAQFPEEEQYGLNYMLHCIRTICQPILAAREFVNPLHQQNSSSPSFVAAPIPISFEQFAASMGAPPLPQQPQDFAFLAQQPPQIALQQQLCNAQPVQSFQSTQSFQQPPVQQTRAPQQTADTGKNFASFDELFKVTKANTERRARVPEITVTAASEVDPSSFTHANPTPSLAFLAPAATQSNVTATNTPGPSKLALMSYIDNNILDFQANVEHLLKEGRVNVTKCQENYNILQWMEDYVKGETGMLALDESQIMKTEIRGMIIKLNALRSPKEKARKLNKDTLALAKKVLSIWD